MLFAGYKTRHMLWRPLRGGAELSRLRGCFLSRIAAGWHTFSRALLAGISRYSVILFSLVCGIIILPLLLGKMWGFSAITDKKKRKLPICLC